MGDIRVKVEHVRAARLCTAGMRVWLAHHGFELTPAVIREGIAVEEIEATGDAFALYVAAIARRAHG
jgi:hypothetical protein